MAQFIESQCSAAGPLHGCRSIGKKCYFLFSLAIFSVMATDVYMWCACGYVYKETICYKERCWMRSVVGLRPKEWKPIQPERHFRLSWCFVDDLVVAFIYIFTSVYTVCMILSFFPLFGFFLRHFFFFFLWAERILMRKWCGSLWSFLSCPSKDIYSGRKGINCDVRGLIYRLVSALKTGVLHALGITISRKICRQWCRAFSPPDRPIVTVSMAS